MNIKPRSKNKMKPTADQTVHVLNNHSLHQALSHYPDKTTIDMNNFLLLTIRKHKSHSLEETVTGLYNNIKFTGPKSENPIHNIKLGMISYYDYTGSRSGRCPYTKEIPPPDHAHALVFGRSKSECNYVLEKLESSNYYKTLHIEQVTNQKESLQHVISYCSKGFAHQYFTSGSTEYDPLIFPFILERPKKQIQLEQIMKERLYKHRIIKDRMEL